VSNNLNMVHLEKCECCDYRVVISCNWFCHFKIPVFPIVPNLKMKFNLNVYVKGDYANF
jgi:hypothetical protein